MGHPNVYVLYNMWSGENKWIAPFSEGGTWLYPCQDSRSSAMPLLFEMTAPVGANTSSITPHYRVLNLLQVQPRAENYLGMSRNNETWLSTNYNYQDALTVEL